MEVSKTYSFQNSIYRPKETNQNLKILLLKSTDEKSEKNEIIELFLKYTSTFSKKIGPVRSGPVRSGPVKVRSGSSINTSTFSKKIGPVRSGPVRLKSGPDRRCIF